MTSAQPEPTDILSKAASVENIMTWLLAQATCKGPREFGWFTRYAADRIPVDVKINMLGDVVDSLPEVEVYAGLQEDLRKINDVRRRVAHAIALPLDGDSDPVYVNLKRGLPNTITADELRKEVSAALDRVHDVSEAFLALGHHLGILNDTLTEAAPMPLAQSYTRRTAWKATMLDDDNPAL